MQSWRSSNHYGLNGMMNSSNNGWLRIALVNRKLKKNTKKSLLTDIKLEYTCNKDMKNIKGHHKATDKQLNKLRLHLNMETLPINHTWAMDHQPTTTPDV